AWSLVMSRRDSDGGTTGSAHLSVGAGFPAMVVPADNALQLKNLGFLDVFAAPTLSAVVDHLRTQQPLVHINAEAVNRSPVKEILSENDVHTQVELSSVVEDGQEGQEGLCLFDVCGQMLACQALQIAATAGHS